MKNDKYDVIVVGSGAAGMVAACTAASLGKRVLVLEAADRLGGTTAISGGMIWIPANQKMKEAGLDDSLDAAGEYLKQTVPGPLSDPRMQAFLARGNEAIHFLEQHTSLLLQPVRRYPDYYPEARGSTAGGRVLEPVPFDATVLGPSFALLRDPLPEFMLFGGMMISREDLPVLRQVGRSLGAIWHATKLVARYARQRLRAHRGTTLVLGNALAARLFKSARDLGVEFALQSPATGMIVDGHRVVGVHIRHNGQQQQLRAKHAVVLATGGISHHQEWRRYYVPEPAGNLSATMPSGALHCGMQLADSVNAQLSPHSTAVDNSQAFWVPASQFSRADGSQGVFPHTVTDRAKPGLIAVNRLGRRFVNEAVSYHEFVKAQLRCPKQNVPAWLVCDKNFLWKYGLGRIRPFALSVRRDIKSGYLKSGNTIEDLALKIGLPPENLKDTFNRFNQEATQGLDSEFGRGSDIYQRHMGDGDNQPNPCVAPISNGPIYSVAVYPADLGMSAGIVTDEHARVLRKDGTPVQGLYACGNDMQSIMNGAYPGPGITLGPALVFGYIAASHACGARPP